jgi:hypothetical protein
MYDLVIDLSLVRGLKRKQWKMRYMVLPLAKTFSEFEKILEKYELPFSDR